MPQAKLKGNIFVRSLVGAAIMLATMLASIIAISAVVGMQDDPLAAIGIASLASVIVSASVGALVVSMLAGESRIAVCLLSGILFIGVMLISGLIISGGAIGGGVILNALIYMGILVLVSLLSSRKKRRRTHRH